MPHQAVKANNAAHLSPCKGEIERGFIPHFFIFTCGVSHLFTFSLFYPFTFKLLTNRKFFNIREHFRFSFFVTNHFLQIEKNFLLFGQKIDLIF